MICDSQQDRIGNGVGISPSGDDTGFRSPELVTVSYDATSRKVTLGGTVVAYWRGNIVPSLVAGWISDAHAVGPTTTLFLKYNDSGLEE